MTPPHAEDGRAPLRRILSALPDLVLLVDGAGRVRMANRGEDGGPPSSLEGRYLADVLGEPRGISWTAALRRCLDEGLPVEAEVATGNGDRVRWHRLVCLRPDGREALCISRDVTETRELAAALARTERILDAVAVSARLLLQGGHDAEGVSRVLALLGEASESSRSNLFRMERQPSGEWTATLEGEWAVGDVPLQADDPRFQQIPVVEAGFSRWIRKLSAGEIVHGAVEDFPTSERPILEDLEIRSTIVVPILVEERLWGFIGLDDCEEERAWTGAERAALQVAADTLGAALDEGRPPRGPSPPRGAELS